MVTKKIGQKGVKVPEKRDGETSTEKFLRECAERAALPLPKKYASQKKASLRNNRKSFFPETASYLRRVNEN